VLETALAFAEGRRPVLFQPRNFTRIAAGLALPNQLRSQSAKRPFPPPSKLSHFAFSHKSFVEPFQTALNRSIFQRPSFKSSKWGCQSSRASERQPRRARVQPYERLRVSSPRLSVSLRLQCRPPQGLLSPFVGAADHSSEIDRSTGRA
jgi:hypothetical protein